MRNNSKRQSPQQQRRITKHVQKANANHFFNLLTSPQLLDAVEAQVPESSSWGLCVAWGSDPGPERPRPGGGEWDASSFKWLRFWIRSDVVDPSGWQDGECGDNPLIVLADPFGHKWVIQKSGAKPDLNDSRSKWLKVEVPLVPGLSPQWQVIDHSGGMFKLAKVKTIEIHVDPWGYGGFSLWVDGLTFVDDAGNTLTDCGI